MMSQVYDAVHHVLVRYGSTLEEHLKCLADVSVIIPEMERLYDGIRGIIVHNSTKVRNILFDNDNSSNLLCRSY